MAEQQKDRLDEAVNLLRSATRVVALTGAGFSTPSGIPDFRSPASGLWEKHNPMEVASLIGFTRRPQDFFEWIRPLAGTMMNAEPNPAHQALADLEKMGKLFAIITQNIDMLHTRAGSTEVYGVHGTFATGTCVSCYNQVTLAPYLERFMEDGEIPRCANDGGIIKPDVILFGEQLPMMVFNKARRAAENCDVMIIAGSSLEVAPVSDMPVVALNHGAQLIVINFESTYIDKRASVTIHDDVARVLPELVNRLTQ